MKRIVSCLFMVGLFLNSAAVILLAQDTPTETPTPAAPTGQTGRQQGPSTEPQPYERVITKDAKSKKGVFTVHQVKDKYFYEIPKTEMGKDFLWVSQIERTTLGVGYGGQALGSRVVRWELGENNRVFLRLVNYSVVADPKLPVAQAVADANNNTISPIDGKLDALLGTLDRFDQRLDPISWLNDDFNHSVTDHSHLSKRRAKQRRRSTSRCERRLCSRCG